MRQRYLFALANLCHLGPNEVDKLSIVDFWSLIITCEQHIREIAKAR